MVEYETCSWPANMSARTIVGGRVATTTGMVRKMSVMGKRSAEGLGVLHIVKEKRRAKRGNGNTDLGREPT